MLGYSSLFGRNGHIVIFVLMAILLIIAAIAGIGALLESLGIYPKPKDLLNPPEEKESDIWH